MKVRFLLCLFLLIFPFRALAWPGVVVSVHDADTLRVQAADGTVEVIRLYGVDAPEKATFQWPEQPWAQEATACLAELLPVGTVVEVRQDQSWRSYGRLVATLILEDGREVNRLLLEAGAVWYYPAYCLLDFCDDWLDAQSRARRSGLGLWQEDVVVAPWIWRAFFRD